MRKTSMSIDFSNVERAIKDYQQGKMLILVDDESRENEGDLIVAANKITEKQMTEMINKVIDNYEYYYKLLDIDNVNILLNDNIINEEILYNEINNKQIL